MIDDLWGPATYEECINALHTILSGLGPTVLGAVQRLEEDDNGHRWPAMKRSLAGLGLRRRARQPQGRSRDQGGGAGCRAEARQALMLWGSFAAPLFVPHCLSSQPLSGLVSG